MSIQTIPRDILSKEIIQYLQGRDLATLASTSRFFHEIADREENWESAAKRDFPDQIKRDGITWKRYYEECYRPTTLHYRLAEAYQNGYRHYHRIAPIIGEVLGNITTPFIGVITSSAITVAIGYILNSEWTMINFDGGISATIPTSMILSNIPHYINNNDAAQNKIKTVFRTIGLTINYSNAIIAGNIANYINRTSRPYYLSMLIPSFCAIMIQMTERSSLAPDYSFSDGIGNGLLLGLFTTLGTYELLKISGKTALCAGIAFAACYTNHFIRHLHPTQKYYKTAALAAAIASGTLATFSILSWGHKGIAVGITTTAIAGVSSLIPYLSMAIGKRIGSLPLVRSLCGQIGGKINYLKTWIKG